MDRRRFVAVAFSLVVAMATSACTLATPSQTNGSAHHATDAAGAAEADTAYVAELTQSLEGNRSQVLDRSASEIDGNGDRLFWRTHDGTSSALHSREVKGEVAPRTLDYAFDIGIGDDANARFSSSMVVTAARESGGIVYRTYDATMPNVALGRATFPAPSDEQKWWAYAADGRNAYVLTTPGANTSTEHQAHTLWRFAPPAQPAALFTLEEAGMSPGIVFDIGVEGDTMVVVESGRLWSIDLARKKAISLGNGTELSGAISVQDDGIVWEEAHGLRYFSRATGTVRDLSAELVASSYRLTETHASAHHFYASTTGRNFSRFGSWIVYTASMGIFGYNLDTRAVAPVLLDSANDGARIAYRYPVALSNGALFVVGLTSSSGSVGADGPVYQVDLNIVLR